MNVTDPAFWDFVLRNPYAAIQTVTIICGATAAACWWFFKAHKDLVDDKVRYMESKEKDYVKREADLKARIDTLEKSLREDERQVAKSEIVSIGNELKQLTDSASAVVGAARDATNTMGSAVGWLYDWWNRPPEPPAGTPNPTG